MNATHTGELSPRARTQVLHRLDQSEWLAATEACYSRVPVDFVYAWEEEFARALEELEVSWRYKPRTFAVDWDDEGNFVDSFTPDFYLPELDLYVELVPSDGRESSAKARKVRLLRRHQPGIRIELLNSRSPSSLQDIFLQRCA